MALKKTYEPGDIEARWYKHWEETGAFKCGQRPDAEPYTIVIPPPNVTGSLHMGHALDETLQDILIRFERLRGKDVLWQPGVDHAGIATQMVVERQLTEQQIDRRDLGREKFLEKVWEWKEQSGGTIENQLRRLGASCDWSRSRFTMDEGFSKAVLEKFVSLYEEGLIYRDKRLVNWDPKFQTAISDLEVEQVEQDGHFWHFRYPVENSDDVIIVATTRPETMLGDTAVAVHPEDDRYKHLVGRHVLLPLVGRRIPIVADEWADPEQGSGAVKITPAHDFNDFEVGKRHDLPMINVLDAHARINENAPDIYHGMDRYEARKAVVNDLKAAGCLEKIEPHRHTVPVGDRSGTVIEPWLTDQWYVDAEKLAIDAIKAVEDGKTTIVPKTWEKTYFEWMRNIQPWCVSRQLWWGHQIPAWYAPDGSFYVARSEEEAYEKARAEHGKDVTLRRDEDVLDTWFSSALWPMGTLGWPEETTDLKRYYPTSTLVTGFDIIFFWVARMMMDGLHFMKEVPFKTVYIHALVRDEEGKKMSKSRGNVVDPLDLIEKYGADALRFTLSSMESQGRDIKMSESRVQGYRNFGTKLWNASRFAEMNDCTGGAGDFNPESATLPLTCWIISEASKTVQKVTDSLDAFRFNDASDAIYHFAWHTFCDWYLELAKPYLQGDDGKEKEEVKGATRWVMDQILVLLHPFMPFITEELWNTLADENRDSDLILAAWPKGQKKLIDDAATAEIEGIIDVITTARSVRADLNVPAGAKIKAGLKVNGGIKGETLIARLARFESLVDGPLSGESVIATPLKGGGELFLDLEGVVDFAAERERLNKAIDKADKKIKALEGRLKNPQYLENAPAHVVEGARAELKEEQEARRKLQDALKQFS